MLYPKANAARAVLDLNGLWRFKLLEGENPFPDSMRDADWIAVPASYNDLREEPRFRTHCGWAAYRRTFAVPSVFGGQRLVLRFDGVTHRARVYLGKKLLLEHVGGFLPFEADVTGLLRPGEEAELTVAVDNRISHATLPVGNEGGTAFFGSDNPGIPSVEEAKKQRGPVNLPNFDFFNYAGINRPVRLYTTPSQYLSGLSVTTGIEGTDGIVSYRVETGGEPGGDVCVDLLDAEGAPVASARGREGVLTVRDARLWEPWPGEPYLYTAVVRYGGDLYEQTVGIRTVEVRGTRFLINGKPFYFKGFGKHEDFAVRGRGFDLCLDVKDVSLIRWINANSFRTSHYPYAEEMYDLCDRAGIVVIDETPAVGIGAGAEQNPYRTFPIRQHHEDVLRDLIRRDQNHPCVVMWSLGNEPDTEHFPEDAFAYWRSLYELARALDPQKRPVTLVCCQNDYTRDLVTRTMDVVCINRYYGWYNLSGDLDAACRALSLELDFWEKQRKPVMMTEYGADTLPGVHMTVPEMFSEEFQVAYYSRLNAEFDKRDFFVGEHPWNFADFATQQGCLRADGNRKGLFTRDRRPKMAAHYFRRRWAGIRNDGARDGEETVFP